MVCVYTRPRPLVPSRIEIGGGRGRGACEEGEQTIRRPVLSRSRWADVNENRDEPGRKKKTSKEKRGRRPRIGVCRSLARTRLSYLSCVPPLAQVRSG